MHKESSVLLAEYLGHAERPVLLLGWQQHKLRQSINKRLAAFSLFPAIHSHRTPEKTVFQRVLILWEQHDKRI